MKGIPGPRRRSMPSLYNALSEKLRRGPGTAAGSLARSDLGLLLFNYRDDLRELWSAADGELMARGEGTSAELRAAVERLRPIFGEREP
jgi:hypothetical protein